MDFLKDTEIGDLYQFNLKGKDPFLVNLSVEQGNDKYKILPMSEDMMKQIKLYNHLLNEVEIFSMMKNDYSISTVIPGVVRQGYLQSKIGGDERH